MRFGITDGPVDGPTHVVEPHGELDLITARELNARLGAALDDGARFVIVDLCDVGFVDSSALGVLLSAQRRAQAGGGTVIVACHDGILRRVFEISGLINVLNVTTSRRDALLLAQEFAATA